jgi:hypothetical protein
MNYVLGIPDTDFKVIWEALSQLPAKYSFTVMERLKQQVESQELSLRQASPSPEAAGQGAQQ